MADFPFADIVDRISKEEGVDPGLIKAVIETESSFNPKLTSKKGAKGLMQLIDSTAKEVGVDDPFDPEKNIRGGTKYLKKQMERFNDPELALAAYNAGPSRVAEYKGIPPFKETKDYVKKVIGLWKGKKDSSDDEEAAAIKGILDQLNAAEKVESQPFEVPPQVDPMTFGLEGDLPERKPFSEWATPQEVLADPKASGMEKFFPAAALAIEAATKEAAKLPITSPSRWISPLTTPLAGVVGGLLGSGAVSKRTVEQLGNVAEALTPLAIDPLLTPALQGAKTVIGSKLPRFKPPTQPTFPTPTVSGVRPPATPSALDKVIEAELAKLSPEDQIVTRELLTSLEKTMGKEEAAGLVFGEARISPAPVKVKVDPKTVMDVDYGEPGAVMIDRPSLLKKAPVTVKKSKMPLEEKTDLIASPPAERGGKIDYGPLADPGGLAPGEDNFTGFWRRILNWAKHHLPADHRLPKEAPNSWVLADLTTAQENMAELVNTFVNQPWYKALKRYTMKEWVDMEHQAVTIWKNGGETSESFAQALKLLPDDVQSYMRWRAAQFEKEQAARKALGLSPIDERSGPYIPRLTNSDYTKIFRIRRKGISLSTDVAQTIGNFGKDRKYATMKEGIDELVDYLDPARAIIMREFEGAKLLETAELMRKLEAHGVIFRDKIVNGVFIKGRHAAEKAAKSKSAVKMVTDLPGEHISWYSPSHAEAQILVDNLSHIEGLGVGSLVHWLNHLFRQPNLFNPLPHFSKNMLYKYKLAGGRIIEFMARDMPEFFGFTSKNQDLVKQFKEIMPYSQIGETAQTLISKELASPSERTANAISRFITKLSSRVLFGYLDPVLRYSLWKQNVKRGMNPILAANHVHVDLVRYGVRSNATDFWKSVPMNMFVPWRVGSVTSVLKQMRRRPIRSALMIGFVDYMRESIYRHTGMWVHLPVDYIEGPITQMVESWKDEPVSDALLTTGLILTASGVFGPGGGFAAGALADGLKSMATNRPVEWNRFKNLYWGLTLLTEVPKDAVAAMRAEDYPQMVFQLGKMLTAFGLGAHEALTYKPHRAMQWLPEGLPGMQKSDAIRELEKIVDTLNKRRKNREKKMDLIKQKYGQTASERIMKSRGYLK